MRVVLSLACALWFSGCAANVGADGLVVGAQCADAFDCASGSFCLATLDFPNGTCTKNCDDDSDCPGASVCVEQGPGVCLLSCTSDEECVREGYFCRERTRRGTLGTVNACVGN